MSQNFELKLKIRMMSSKWALTKSECVNQLYKREGGVDVDKMDKFL